jgi:hypothetical protein
LFSIFFFFKGYDSLALIKEKFVINLINSDPNNVLTNWKLNFVIKNEIEYMFHNNWNHLFYSQGQYNPKPILPVILENPKIVFIVVKHPSFLHQVFLKDPDFYNSYVIQVLNYEILFKKSEFCYKFFHSPLIINKFISDPQFFKIYFSEPKLQNELLNQSKIRLKICLNYEYFKTVIEQNNQYLNDPRLKNCQAYDIYVSQGKPSIYETFTNKIISFKNYLLNCRDLLISKVSNLFADNQEIINNNQDNIKDKDK